tara:strand:+ start:1029 stop:1394 length:366 start_codon:yes stop_codon:yes gene_type:complete
METFESVVIFFHVLIAIAITALILIQHGKGADAGAGFGSGASSTVFGAGGPGSFLVKLTAFVAVLFFVTSFSLAFFAKERSSGGLDAGVPVLEENSNNGLSKGKSSVLGEFTKEESEIPEG